jgi:predicted nucleic-acid-binding protein
MRAVDTNVLVRLVVRDSPEQARLAESFIASGAWVSHLVLAEAMWVLDAVYDRTPEQIAGAIDMLLNPKDLSIQAAEVVTGNRITFPRKRRPTPSERCFLEPLFQSFRPSGLYKSLAAILWPQTRSLSTHIYKFRDQQNLKGNRINRLRCPCVLRLLYRSNSCQGQGPKKSPF